MVSEMLLFRRRGYFSFYCDCGDSAFEDATCATDTFIRTHWFCESLFLLMLLIVLAQNKVFYLPRVMCTSMPEMLATSAPTTQLVWALGVSFLISTMLRDGWHSDSQLRLPLTEPNIFQEIYARLSHLEAQIAHLVPQSSCHKSLVTLFDCCGLGKKGNAGFTHRHCICTLRTDSASSQHESLLFY